MVEKSDEIISKGPNFSKVENEDLIFILKANFDRIKRDANDLDNKYIHQMLKEYLIRNLTQNNEVKKIIERLEQLIS